MSRKYDLKGVTEYVNGIYWLNLLKEEIFY